MQGKPYTVTWYIELLVVAWCLEVMVTNDMVTWCCEVTEVIAMECKKRKAADTRKTSESQDCCSGWLSV